MPRVREKLAWGLVAALGLFVVASITGVVSGGPLDPTGPPASTDGVRQPGTPISSLPFSITQPGYYYVTRSLTGGTFGNGISITSHDVTVDLGGFTITGGTLPGDGILVNLVGGQSAKNIVIRNGAVNSWNSGINASVAIYSKVHDVTALTNQSIGIKMGQAFHSELWNCNASFNGQGGITLGFATVRSCTVTDNAGPGIFAAENTLVENNKIRNNSVGISLLGPDNTLRGNELAANSFDVFFSGTALRTVLIGNLYCFTAVDVEIILASIDNIHRPC